jgi:hypothetical protein
MMGARGLWRWTSVVLLVTTGFGVWLPRAVAHALYGQVAVAGMGIAFVWLVWPPSGPDAVVTGVDNGRNGRW